MGVIDGLPWQVGYGLSGFVATDSSSFDVKIGDLEFMLAVGPENPLIRRGADYRTQQVNFSAEPGETALGFWWQREQSTWHYGAGNPTFDGPGSGNPDIAVGRFNESYGVNVWEPDEFSLCDDTSQLQLGSGFTLTPFVNVKNLAASGESVFWALDDVLYEYNNSIVLAYDGDNPGFGWGFIGSLASDGAVVYLLDNENDIIWGVGDIDSNSTVVIRQLYTGIPSATLTNSLRFAKQRLIAAFDNDLYEIERVTATTAWGAPTPFYSHPREDWTWTDIFEGPGAIYAAGYAGSYSAVYKFVLEDDGALPSLSSGIVAMEVPAGETIHRVCPYLGIFAVVGTTAGVRVCTFNGTDIALAPLTYETTSAVQGITAWGDFVFANVADAGNGYRGLIKIDLSKEVEEGRYAWANDMRANTSTTDFSGISTGTPTRMTTLKGRPIFGIQGQGVFARQNTRRSPEGSLTSGRMLFGMTDPKHFLRVAMSGTGTGTATLLTGVDSEEATTPQVSLDFAQQNSVDLLTSGLLGGSLTLGVTLSRDPDSTNSGPTINSVSAKALPAQPRERQWVLPLRVYTRVEGGFGQTIYQNARDVIDSLEELVRTQEPVLLQTFFGDPERDWTNKLVHVEDFEYRQVTAEPSASWGGLLSVSLRTISG